MATANGGGVDKGREDGEVGIVGGVSSVGFSATTMV